MTVDQVLEHMAWLEARRADLIRLLGYAQADDDTVAVLEAEVFPRGQQRAFTQPFPGAVTR